jgi:protocatechuate 3,4-dioxygenase, beta subunit
MRVLFVLEALNMDGRTVRDTCATERLLDLPRAAPARSVIVPPGERGVPLVLRGRVLLADGRPVPGVIVYVYHTNAAGQYPKRGGLCGAARWHGYLRGFAMSDAAGNYEFVTIRPGTYVERDTPAHLHLTVTTSRPPSVARMAWIDDVMFDDDPLLTPSWRRRLEGRGGSGVVTPRRARGDTVIVTRDIRWDFVPGVAAPQR